MTGVQTCALPIYTMKTMIERDVSVRNVDLEYLFFDKSDVEVKMELTTNMKGKVSVGELNFEISPDEVEPIANLSFKSEISDRVGLYYSDLKPKDFRTSDLILSDIEFASNIEPTPTADHFSKNGLRILPHISEIVHKNNSLFIYFEIYNLTKDTDGDTRYRVEYIISRRGAESIAEITRSDTLNIRLEDSIKRDKNYIAMSDDFVKKDKNTFEWLAFDLKDLAVGQYVFTVKITDKVKGTSAVTKKHFTLKK